MNWAHTLRAAFVASCLRGAFPPVDFLAVCLVRAICNIELCKHNKYTISFLGKKNYQSLTTSFVVLVSLLPPWQVQDHASTITARQQCQ